MTKRSRPMAEKQTAPESNPAPPSQEKSRRTPLWQAVVLPLAAVLIFFLLLEGGLALFGVKPAVTEDPFVGFAGNVPLFVPTPGPGGAERMVTAENKLNFFNAQSFPRQKAPGTYRIFCLGGSTTYGRPYNDTTSFAGWLRELLPAADGEKHWEVINAGGISYASYRVAHLMEELVNYQPDLFIIYTGHNEFLEERTYSKLREMPAPIRSTVSLLARTRTWAAMSGAMKKMGIHPQIEAQKGRDQLGTEVDAILERSAGLDRYTRDDQLQQNILKHYRISLERMVDLARSAGAQVIFVTPASNLKDCSPFKSEHTAGLDLQARQRSEKLLAEAGDAIGREDWNGALEHLDAALALDPRHAGLLYRRGKALLALGRYDDAAKALTLAKDEDVCPLRALTPMLRIVKEVAREQGVPLVDFVDLLQRRIATEKGYSTPGEEYFLDHVHPTIEGNRILALALLQSMADNGLVRPGADWGEQRIAAVAARVEGRVDKRAHGQALANLARVLLWAGKVEDAGRLAGQAFETAGEYQQVAVDSASILTSVYQKQGEQARALQLLYSAIEKAPGAMELRLKLGLALLNPSFFQPQEAAANLLLVCQQLPQWDVAHQFFGMAMARGGRPEVAYPSLLEALRLNPNNAEARRALDQIPPYVREQASPQLPQVTLAIYPSISPRSLVQLRRGANGRPVPDGIEVEFHENGRTKRYLEVTLGVPNGLELTWGPDGRLLSRVVYRNGVPVKSGQK